MCLAIPGKILTIYPAENPTMTNALVSFGGIKKNINISMIPEANVDNYVLVHVGVAISIIDEVEAQKTLRFLEITSDINNLSNESL